MSAKPSPLQWVRYAFGGRLPPSLHEWVRHDLTDAGWRGREVFRVIFQCIIPVAIIMSLPGPVQIRGLTAALVLFGAIFIAAAYGDDLRDRRLKQHDLLKHRDRDLDRR